MEEFKHARSGGYHAASQPRDVKVMEDLKRNWQRHPELRAQYKNFQHYLCDVRHNVQFA